MTDPGTPGIFRWVNGRYVFVPARRPEIGEACLLYPVNGDYLAVPLARPNVADPVIVEPVGGRYVAVPFLGIGGGSGDDGIAEYSETAAAILAYLGAVVELPAPGPLPMATILGYWPRRVEAIGPTSAIILAESATGRGGRRIFRTDDSGATWVDEGDFAGATSEHGGGLGGIVGTDLAGNYLVSGAPIDAPANIAIWRFDTAAQTSAKVWEVTPPTASDCRAHRLLKTGAGYFLGTMAECYFSPDGDSWSAVGPYPFYIAPNRTDQCPPICPSGGTIYIGYGSLDSPVSSTGVWKSDDNGASWTHIFTPTGSRFCGCILAGWRDGSLLYGGGNCSGATQRLFLSRNRGATWAELPAPVFPRPDSFLETTKVSHIEAVPGSRGVAFATSDIEEVGVIVTRDYGASWETSNEIATTLHILDGAVLPGGISLAAYCGYEPYGIQIYRAQLPV